MEILESPGECFLLFYFLTDKNIKTFGFPVFDSLLVIPVYLLVSIQWHEEKLLCYSSVLTVAGDNQVLTGLQIIFVFYLSQITYLTRLNVYLILVMGNLCCFSMLIRYFSLGPPGADLEGRLLFLVYKKIDLEMKNLCR